MLFYQSFWLRFLVFLPLFLAYIKIEISVLSSLGSDFVISPPLLNLTFKDHTILFLMGALIIIIFLSNWNILRPSLLTTRFLFLIWMLPLPKSFFTLKVFTLQLGRYCTLLRFSICVFPVSVTQIIILLLKLSGLAYPPAVSSNGRDTGIYIPVLKLLMDLAIWVSALVLNSIPSCLISDWFFLFR